MTRLDYIKAAVLLSLLFPIAYFGLILRDIHQGHTLEIKLNLPQFDSVATDLDATAKTLGTAAQSQADYYSPTKPGGITQQTYRLIAYAKDAIGRTDINLNGGINPITHKTVVGTLPTLSATLQSTGDLSTQATQKLNDTFDLLQPTLKNLSTSSDALATGIPPIMQNIQHTSEQAAVATTNGADAMHNVDMTTADIRAFVHRETTPIRGTWHAIKSFLFEIAGPASSVATAAK